MKIQRFESLFLESPPWVEGSRFDPDLGFSVSVPELPAAWDALPEEFHDAVAEIDRQRDSLPCWRCGELIGWVFMEGPVAGHLDWVPTALVREIRDDAPPPATFPVRPMCAHCAPYVDPESYRDTLRALMQDG